MTRPRRPPAAPTPPPRKSNEEERDRWALTKDKLLVYVGLVFAAATFVWSEVLAHDLHYEWLVFSAALCGLGIMHGLDRKDRD